MNQDFPRLTCPLRSRPQVRADENCNWYKFGSIRVRSQLRIECWRNFPRTRKANWKSRRPLHESLSSNHVISGDMNFTGRGTVFAGGGLRPGNSPGVGIFEGDLVLGQSAGTFVELGGLWLGQFDMFDVAGDLSLSGSLDVALIDGFSLGFSQEFLIADVEGSMTGMFSGLNEGATVGNFGGQDLFITYNGFGGNRGVGLFTSVPEPSSEMLLGLLGVNALLYRRRQLSAN